jgi:hypothetical protein
MIYEDPEQFWVQKQSRKEPYNSPLQVFQRKFFGIPTKILRNESMVLNPPDIGSP